MWQSQESPTQWPQKWDFRASRNGCGNEINNLPRINLAAMHNRAAEQLSWHSVNLASNFRSIDKSYYVPQATLAKQSSCDMWHHWSARHTTVRNKAYMKHDNTTWHASYGWRNHDGVTWWRSGLTMTWLLTKYTPIQKIEWFGEA